MASKLEYPLTKFRGAGAVIGHLTHRRTAAPRRAGIHGVLANNLKASSVERFSLDEDVVDRVLERAVLGVGSLNERFEEMDAYTAVSGFREAELPLLDAKLLAVMKEVDPERQEERLTRVLELANLPDPATAEGTVDIERLLAAREEEELVEFRKWLRTLDSATDEEIIERVNSIRERISGAVYGDAGKAVRFAATVAADVLPFGGIVVGALDQFVLEKVLPEPGPVSFLGSTYPSLFKSD
jgi:hypothetical protein